MQIEMQCVSIIEDKDFIAITCNLWNRLPLFKLMEQYIEFILRQEEKSLSSCSFPFHLTSETEDFRKFYTAGLQIRRSNKDNLGIIIQISS